MSALYEKVKQLRADLAAAEEAYRKDIDRRREALAAEERTAFGSPAKKEKARVCGACGEAGHTARKCQKKKVA